MKSISTERSFDDLAPFSDQLNQYLIDSLDARYNKVIEAEKRLSTLIDNAVSNMSADAQASLAKCITDIIRASVEDSKSAFYKKSAISQLLSSLAKELQAVSAMSDLDAMRKALQIISSQTIVMQKTIEQ